MKKLSWSGVVLIVFIMIVLGFLFSMITAIYGNPVTKLIATAQIRSYVDENYPDMDLEVTKAVYNFKCGDYVSQVQSTTSMDTAFSVSWYSGKIDDTYEINVLQHYRTYQRLQQELSNKVEEVIGRDFPYETSILFADLDKSMDDYSALTLDMPLDTETFPMPTTLTIYFYQDKIEYEVFCERLQELKKIMKKNKIRMDYYSVVMEEASEDGEKPISSGKSIYLYDYPAEKIDSETLSEDIQKYMDEWEAEHEK